MMLELDNTLNVWKWKHLVGSIFLGNYRARNTHINWILISLFQMEHFYMIINYKPIYWLFDQSKYNLN